MICAKILNESRISKLIDINCFTCVYSAVYDGQSYAIPTVEGLDNLKPAVDRFIAFASQHPEYKFLVTHLASRVMSRAVMANLG